MEKMAEKPVPEPAADPAATPPGSDGAPPVSIRVIPLRRVEPVADDVSLADEATRADDTARAADAALVATDDDPELGAALPVRRRWYLSLPASGKWQPPITGGLAVIFGIASLFKLPLFFAPLAIFLALIAGWRGHHGWAVIGLGTALVGLLTSFWFWAWLGMAWLYQSWG